MPSREEIVVKIRALKPLLRQRYKATGFELFGSRARAEDKDESDIDILVDFEEGADLLHLVGLSIFLEEQLKGKIDVVPRRALREELRESILRQAIPI